jgi:glycosyltransferase 2 family protein
MIKSAIKWTVCIVVLAFVIHALAQQFRRIDWSSVQFNPWPLAGAAFFLLLVPPVQLTSYRTLLAAYAQAPPWRVMAAVAWVPPLGKYVPGKVASLAGAIYMLRRFAIPAPIAISVVLAMDGLAVVTGLMLGAPLINLLNIPNAGILIGIVIAGGVVCLHPSVYARLLNFVLIRLKRQPLDHVPDWKHYIVPVLCAFGQWILAGIALWFVARSVAQVDVRQIPRFISIAGLGYTIGYLALFAPAGLGPRDLVFAKAMELVVVPPAMSAVAAVAVRIIQTFTEMTAAMVGLLILRKLDKKESDQLAGK